MQLLVRQRIAQPVSADQNRLARLQGERGGEYLEMLVFVIRRQAVRQHVINSGVFNIRIGLALLDQIGQHGVIKADLPPMPGGGNVVDAAVAHIADAA